MENINSMDYQELCELKRLVDGRLSHFRPVRIKTKWRRCGKGACVCMDGPADGTWGNLHGPYIFAQFVDPAIGSTRLVSLGRHRDWTSEKEDAPEILDIRRFFKLNSDQYGRLTEKMREKFWYSYTMSAEEYERAYGREKSSSGLAGYDTFYADKAGHDAFVAASDELVRRRRASMHEWAEEFGIATYKGQGILEEILRGPYYLDRS